SNIEALKKEVENLRNLKFREKIKIEYVSQKQISDLLNSEMTRQFSLNKLENYETALKVFGLIPRKSSLKDLVENLMSSQAAGIYDPKTKTMYVLNTNSEPEGDEFFNLAKAMNINDIFIVHELAHALADQNFDLQKSLNLEDVGNEDRQIAGLSVAEGDATMVMLKYLAKTMNLADADISDISNAMGDFNFYGEFLGETVPRYLKETLLFSYTEGLKFVIYVSKRKEQSKIDHLYRNPPESTEEVIHPEKYLSQNDKPKAVKINWEELKKEGALQKVWEGTWGELGTRIILGEWGVEVEKAQNASSGWGGDRYLVYQDSSGDILFVWKSVWDTEKDAREFEENISLRKDVFVLRKENEVLIKKRKAGKNMKRIFAVGILCLALMLNMASVVLAADVPEG
ncbi:MAG: hypothetical protein N2445_08510, partial [Acidobacteria bacterium]|nr:hypothetical protein [Acidobacteriota bacterium]